ncbi:hypothetical protein PHYSODRAFT_524811 [Phytophthora sojae]|uniref:Uncharacterized protein n=1 Tax=Phytophthora sojae (strain P6497) TaxID=1094619 RepID=G5A789_PHYSP|nr:hypothetical protein PHYSODRAFT_524811 [Phytophthora sojae]EGZ09194.1 hypothetical protein PHYSODRAFT_524811 [Phytophthora sojae]|eukprot:XP_009535827.1 hypothetical protein PHYSODRAFT_524811 [Phytophthora sojae]
MGSTASLSSYTMTTPSAMTKWCCDVSGTGLLKGSYGISSRWRSFAAAPAARGLVGTSAGGGGVLGSLTVIHFLRSSRHLRMSPQTSLVSLSTSSGGDVIWMRWYVDSWP